MSAVIKRIPRDQRLRITAKYRHETIQFQGDVFQFIAYIQEHRLTGKGEFTANQGAVLGLHFDLRELVVQDVDALPAKTFLDSESG